MFASRQNFLRLAKRGDHCTWPRARGIRGSQKAACRAGVDQRVGAHQSFSVIGPPEIYLRQQNISRA
ncbi:MAG: hypothetical protein DMG29_12350 [Acidobacteria bacterium]|nr:MAG: hypothetical protein DMG29_12350 [Acidobacteriota bacterium]